MAAGTVDIQPVVADIRARVLAAWPEVGVNGIWDAEHVNSVPWLTLVMPYAVILIESLPISDFAIDSLVFEPEVSVYYVSEQTGASLNLREKLDGFSNEIWPDDGLLTKCQVLDVTDISWADNLQPNAVFQFANHVARAGRVVFTILMK